MPLSAARPDLNDPALLENAEHPGRRFLASVEGLAPYCGSLSRDDPDGMWFDRDLERIVSDIESGAVTDIRQATAQIGGAGNVGPEQSLLDA